MFFSFSFFSIFTLVRNFFLFLIVVIKCDLVRFFVVQAVRVFIFFILFCFIFPFLYYTAQSSSLSTNSKRKMFLHCTTLENLVCFALLVYKFDWLRACVCVRECAKQLFYSRFFFLPNNPQTASSNNKSKIFIFIYCLCFFLFRFLVMMFACICVYI